MKFYTKVWGILLPCFPENRLFKKLLMSIKLTLITTLALITQVSANGFSQITLKGKNIPIREIIFQIEKQSKFVFLYDGDKIDDVRVTLNLHDVQINDALKTVLKGTDIEYSILENNILLKKKKPSILEKIDAIFTIAKDLDFKVIGEDGVTLIGATLKTSKSNQIYLSDNKGYFHIKDVENETLLEISFIGYESINIAAGKITGTVSLKKRITNLEEVLINKGYYTTKQKLNTGSAVQINASALERQPLTNPITSLQGLVPGMYIKQGSGVAGAANTVLIRGRNSLNSGVAPLYILDGIPFSSTPVDRQVGAGAQLIGGQPNISTDPLSVINPADIESITILKDADATAIYGSRGSNGVILITTKKAKPGTSSFNFTLQRGFGEVVKQLDLLPLSDYLALRRQAFVNDNRTTTAAIAPDLLLWDQNNATNYQDLLIGNTSKTIDATASVSVSSVRSSMLLSGTYRDEKSILYGGKGYKRGTVNLSGTTSSADDRLKVGIATSASFAQNNMPGADFTASLYSIPQNYPTTDANGNFYWVNNFNNPIATSRQGFKNDNTNFNINANLSYKIIDALIFKTNLGYNRIDQTQTYTVPASTQNNLNSVPVSGGLYSSSNTQAIVAESQFDYAKNFGNHHLTLSAGGTWQGTEYETPYLISANTFASETLLGSFTNAANFTAVRAVNASYKYLSFFGRANYNFKEKYVINATLRRDGSSRFGPDRKFGSFGAVGAAWIFSDEDLIKNLDFLSYGKLRASYGITGNDQIDNYGYSDTYTSTSSSYGGNPGFYPTRIANPTYSWESNRKLEVALELGFFKDRIHLIPSFYRNRSDNMIVRNTPLPAQTGFSGYTTNLDALVQNQGYELELKVQAIKTKSLIWDLNFNITKTNSKLLSLPASATTLYANTYEVGQPISTLSGYHFLGFVNGVAQFEDKNGDGAITTGLTGDSYIYGQRDPEYYGGVSSALSYKGFRLDVLFNFVKQKGFLPFAYPGALGAQLGNLTSSPFIPSTTTTSASYISYNRYLQSDALSVDASYIRLRNLSLSYSIPEKWARKYGATNTRLFVMGQNLLTITGYDGLDPETQTGVLPPLKIFTAGLSCSF